MISIATALALLLGLIGIYSAISYVVMQRTREIGIRSALGAQRHNIQGLILRYGLTLTGLGMMTGLAAAIALTRLMRSLLFGVEPFDLWTYATVMIVLSIAAAAAALLPARRAARVDPLVALRYE